jgi:hypothetical protein
VGLLLLRFLLLLLRFLLLLLLLLLLLQCGGCSEKVLVETAGWETLEFGEDLPPA